MSYDVIVFDPAHAPTEPASRRSWFDELLLSDDEAVASDLVRGFHDAAADHFGARACLDLTAHAAILTCAFADGAAALPEITRLAARRGLAVYDYSGSGKVTLPPRRPDPRPATSSSPSPAAAIARLLEAPARTGQACRTRGG